MSKIKTKSTLASKLGGYESLYLQMAAEKENNGCDHEWKLRPLTIIRNIFWFSLWGSLSVLAIVSAIGNVEHLLLLAPPLSFLVSYLIMGERRPHCTKCGIRTFSQWDY